MNKDELRQLLGDDDITKVLDVKTLVLDLIRHEKLPHDVILELFWAHLESLDESFVMDYFYRRY